MGRVPVSDGGGGLVTESCLTLETPWTVAHQAPLSMGLHRQEYWSEWPFPSPGDVSCIACRFFTTEPTGEKPILVSQAALINVFRVYAG